MNTTLQTLIQNLREIISDIHMKYWMKEELFKGYHTVISDISTPSEYDEFRKEFEQYMNGIL